MSLGSRPLADNRPRSGLAIKSCTGARGTHLNCRAQASPYARSSIQAARQKITLHRQLSNLGMKVFNLGVHVRRRSAGLATCEHTAEPIQSLPLPLTYLVGMQLMPRRNLRKRLIAPQSLKRNFRLEIITKSSAFAHVVSSSKGS